MKSQLAQLSEMTTVVADTGDIDAISKYTPEDLTLMKQGRAPMRVNPKTGELEIMECHHCPPQCEGGLFDFSKTWPRQHELIDKSRYIKNE